MIFVDSHQSPGNSVIDVKRTNVDFLAAGSQKYLLGIPGRAYLYVRKDLIQHLEPSFTGWFSQGDPFKFAWTRIEYAPDANRFAMHFFNTKEDINKGLGALKRLLKEHGRK
jgi:selenocysteine lyase/cysteine desulfurase